ncbi:MAG: NAD(P)-binding domain-containing protein, partial [Bacteroidetes bacterium]|nr:NAD(P)-binding domain-containing protein [Bacteroidota bacterium]
MNIGIIGAGNMGGSLGPLWASKDHNIVFGLRQPDNSKYSELAELQNIKLGSIKECIEHAEVLLLAIPYDQV